MGRVIRQTNHAVPGFQARRASSREPGRWFALFGKTILDPGISRVGITADFPESQDIAVQEGYFANEFSALPGISLWNNDSGGPTMVGSERLFVPFVRHQHVIVEADLQGIIGGIAVVAFKE